MLIASTGSSLAMGFVSEIYRNGEFREQLFPFDVISRKIGKEEFATLEKGLIQRVTALNLFLKDVYNEKRIIRDKIIPEDFIYSSSGYNPKCEGFIPPEGIYSHISGIDLVKGKDGSLYFRSYGGRRERIGALYRRISDEYLDPVEFCHDSLIGVPNLFQAYRKGNAAVINAFGNGVADDKGIYYFVPKMIRYYLNEEPILNNAPTYLPYYEEDYKYTVEHFDSLVVKDVAEAGGYGVIFVAKLDKKKRDEFLELYKSERRRFIAQEVIDFEDLDTVVDGKIVPRKADLRAFVLTGSSVVVWKSGLTRFSRNPDSFIVNSSQGGGFKDTWVFQ